MGGIAAAIAEPKSLAGTVVRVRDRLKDIETPKIRLSTFKAMRNTNSVIPALLESGLEGHKKAS
jgi:hypothetical protein